MITSRPDPFCVPVVGFSCIPREGEQLEVGVMRMRRVKTMPAFQVLGKLWVHPDNVDVLRKAFDDYNAKEGT